jgi:hypothetical protein
LRLALHHTCNEVKNPERKMREQVESFTRIARWAIALGMGAMVGSVFAVEDTDLSLGDSYSGSAPGGTPPWVNILFRDFSDADPGAYGTFEWIRNTVEVQITTRTTADGAPFDDPGGSCCPVVGKGNLTGRERLSELYLNLNHALDPRKLKIYWTGKPMAPGPAGSNVFPAAGLAPVSIKIDGDAFQPGDGAGRFDIRLRWAGDEKLGQDGDWSKLLFVYDDANTDISAEDFLVVSKRAKSKAGPFIAVGRIKNTHGHSDNGWIKD